MNDSAKLKDVSKHIYGIDVLRFFSAVMVATLHYRANGEANSFFQALLGKFHIPAHAPTAAPSGFDFMGYLGVQIFFMISGFVISGSLTRSQGPRKFFEGRFLRIYPTLVICTVMSLILCWATGNLSLGQGLVRFVRSLLLTPFGQHVDDVVWTLSVEVIFYAVAGILFFAGDKKLNWLLVYLTASSCFFWTAIFLDQTFHLLPSSHEQLFYKIGRTCLWEYGQYFSLGIIIYRLNILKNVGAMQRMLAGVCVFLAAANLIFITNFFASDPHNAGAFKSPVPALIVFFISALAMQFFVRYRGIWAKLPAFALKIIEILGLSTYPFYLSHYFIGSLFALTVSLFDGQRYVTISVVIGTTIISSIIAKWIDPPVGRAFKAGIALIFDVVKFGASRPIEKDSSKL